MHDFVSAHLLCFFGRLGLISLTVLSVTSLFLPEDNTTLRDRLRKRWCEFRQGIHWTLRTHEVSKLISTA
jgi:hypothetical protein